jgi:hypothetical protein
VTFRKTVAEHFFFSSSALQNDHRDPSSVFGNQPLSRHGEITFNVIAG